MAIQSAPGQTPSVYSTPTITRAGTLISELNIVTPRPYERFMNKFNFTPYMLLTQMQNNGMIKITQENSNNKMFYHYEDYGRQMGFFVAAGTVAGANGAGVTITQTAGSHSAAGTRSLPEIGKIFYNSRTAVESRVSAVNKTVAGAHVVTLTPVVATQSAAVNAGDELLDRGYKYVGEASDYTGTNVKNIARFTNYCSQLRKDFRITDLALAEQIDFEYNGQRFYWYKGMDDMNNQLIQEKELMLLDSNLATNLPYAESGTAGLIQQITANGVTATYNDFSATQTLQEIERVLDNQGAPMEYDFLSDTDQDLDIQDAIATEFPNGAIVYDQNNLRRDFKSFKPYTRKFNFARYTPLSERRMYGSSGTGARSGFGILVPKNTTTLDGDSRVNDVPRLIVRYQEIQGKQLVVGESGLLSANGQNTKADLTISQVGYYGLQAIGADQFMILKKA